jgi:hypothetical protein
MWNDFSERNLYLLFQFYGRQCHGHCWTCISSIVDGTVTMFESQRYGNDVNFTIFYLVSNGNDVIVTICGNNAHLWRSPIYPSTFFIDFPLKGIELLNYILNFILSHWCQWFRWWWFCGVSDIADHPLLFI